MIEFRQKDFTIPEGHYTGPKDQEKLPGAVEIIGKSALIGSLGGAVIGKISKEISTLKGAAEGGKYGALAGIAFKLFLNHLHKPMSTIKYQEVDKNIRREFGIYRIADVTIGDKIDKRAKIEEKFGFNDRNVTNYKINVSISNNEVTLYTFNMTSDEIDKLSHILDYYCKKYYGMNYTSSLINQKINAYSVNIVFTNYQVISNFIMEVSNEMCIKINLLDCDALVKGKLVFASNDLDENGEEEEEKNFSSIKRFNKFDIAKIIESTVNSNYLLPGRGLRGCLSAVVMETVIKSIQRAGQKELTRIPMFEFATDKEDYDNSYLKSVLDKNHFVEGFRYTVGDDKATSNISMVRGVFLITTKKDSEDTKLIDDKFWKHLKTKVNRADTGKVIIYSYNFESGKDFEFMIKKLMSTGIVFNIFTK